MSYLLRKAAAVPATINPSAQTPSRTSPLRTSTRRPSLPAPPATTSTVATSIPNGSTWRRDKPPVEDSDSPEDLGLQMKRLSIHVDEEEEEDVHRTDSGVGEVSYEESHAIHTGRKRYRIDTTIPEVQTDLSTVQFAMDRAHDDRPVVLKKAKDRTFSEVELSILRTISAKGIKGCVELVDCFDEGDTFVMVFPFYKKLKTKGSDLLDIRRKAKFIMATLAELHSIGIVHLDLCTNNILEDLEGTPVLIDFGLARLCGKEPHPVGRGTPGFVAPEILSSTRAVYGTEPDVYSFGVVLGSLLEPFFPTQACLHYLGGKLIRPSTTEMIQSKLREFLDEKPDPSLPKVVYDAADLLIGMLESDPQNRVTADMALRHPFLTIEEGAFLGTEIRSFSRSPSLTSLGSSGRRAALRVIERDHS
ncbi:kinase-like protein [Gonapodya prolifera JEL478]|uniref:Kinase-like protein n=1 Tax=Gonapodya prolifera (strain JEL478) TaxID=1344416 RepID=A0A139A6R5_GONPJ|nr:kinase-like protein [Gonapodya prolifera JEL478]|eukprot:KXS12461.1 kinase-like protein [Gonapodya prolifera JEL478]